MTRPCHNSLPRNTINKLIKNNRITYETVYFALGLILDATLRAIIDAIWDVFRGKHGTKIDARTIIEPGPF